jgi:hypothetical protein
MRALDFIAGSSSRGIWACSHIEAVRFQPCLKEAGSESSGAVSRVGGADESGKEDIFKRDKTIKYECWAEFKNC